MSGSVPWISAGLRYFPPLVSSTSDAASIEPRLNSTRVSPAIRSGVSSRAGPVEHEAEPRADRQEQVVEALVVGHRPGRVGGRLVGNAEALPHARLSPLHALHDEDVHVQQRRERGDHGGEDGDHERTISPRLRWRNGEERRFTGSAASPVRRPGSSETGCRSPAHRHAAVREEGEARRGRSPGRAPARGVRARRDSRRDARRLDRRLEGADAADRARAATHRGVRLSARPCSTRAWMPRSSGFRSTGTSSVSSRSTTRSRSW